MRTTNLHGPLVTGTVATNQEQCLIERIRYTEPTSMAWSNPTPPYTHMRIRGRTEWNVVCVCVCARVSVCVMTSCGWVWLARGLTRLGMANKCCLHIHSTVPSTNCLFPICLIVSNVPTQLRLPWTDGGISVHCSEYMACILVLNFWWPCTIMLCELVSTWVSLIINSVISIGRYWGISTVLVIGILIVLLTNCASMMS